MMGLAAIMALAALGTTSVLADQPIWGTFNGNLAATKFADAATLTPDSAGDLARAWSVRTGDVSDGSGDLPATVWSATPIYANGTLYLGTPFYRIIALDPATGEERWSYDTCSTLEALTQPALKSRGVAYWESGAEGACEKRMIPVTGTANIWSSMSADPDLGLVYVPVSSPAPNYWGGNRLQGVPLATSITAVDIATGAIAWSFQHTRHDIWDYDTPSAPTLVDLTIGGEAVPALVQTTKQGLIWVLDRRTGAPLFPVEDRPVPPSHAEGEVASPTQPFPTRPLPTVPANDLPATWPLADALSFGQCSADREAMRYDGPYTPPSVEGSFMWPGTAGTNNWGGAAVDPRTGILYVNSSRVVRVIRLIPRADYKAEVQAATGSDSVEGGNEAGFHPQEGAPYGIELTEWRTAIGLPCWEPPYGPFSAYDLNTGERLYEVPFGLSQQWGFHGLRSWGSPRLGGPVVTSGGVVLIGASMDNRVRALDAATGEELWFDVVAAPAVSIPAVFTHEGADYVVWAVGGNSILKPSVADQVVAYRLGE